MDPWNSFATLHDSDLFELLFLPVKKIDIVMVSSSVSGIGMAMVIVIVIGIAVVT